MAVSTKTTSIFISIVIAAGLITGAFFLSSPTGAPSAGAESSEELLRAYAAKDTDADGLHDWLEELYGADPANPHSLDAVLNDREAVDAGKVTPKFASEAPASELSAEQVLAAVPGDVAADSVTERFARQFFEGYMLGEGSGQVPTDDDLVAFVDSSIAGLFSSNQASGAFSRNSLVVVPGGEEALRTYAAAAETAGRTSIKTADKSELEYFSDAVYGSDTAALAKLDTVATAYKGIAATMMRISVPEEAADAHLALANAFSRLGIIVEYMAAYDEDPVLAFMGISAYEGAVHNMAGALDRLYGVFVTKGVVLEKREQGYSFYETLQTAHMLVEQSQ